MVKSIFIGRLGADVEKVSTGSTEFYSCRVAVDDTNGKEKSTRWINVSADANRFRNLAQYLTKGKMIYVTGNERVSPYLSKTGEPGVDTRVWADSIEFVSTGTKQEGQTDEKTDKDERNEKMTTGKLKTKKLPEKVEDESDDLPF